MSWYTNMRRIRRYTAWCLGCCLVSSSVMWFLVLNFLPTTIKRPIIGTGSWNVRLVSSQELTRVDITAKHDGAIMPTQLPPSNIVPPKASTYSLCVIFEAGLGNQMFQFASLYGLAAKKGMSVTIDRNENFTKVFKLDIDMENQYNNICKTFPDRDETLDCGYDESLDTFTPNTSYRIMHFLQSWKYFYNSSTALRKQFVFHDTIIERRNKIIYSILDKHNFTSRSEVTFIGVHVRRGDMLNLATFGYVVASESYLRKGINYFKSKGFKNTLFIICSNDMSWTRKHMVDGIHSEYVTGHSEGVEMAVLGSCDHMITSVGTFGWWSAWLTGGEVTFYQWPARDGSALRQQFSKDYTDFFHPGWIGFS